MLGCFAVPKQTARSAGRLFMLLPVRRNGRLWLLAATEGPPALHPVGRHRPPWCAPPSGLTRVAPRIQVMSEVDHGTMCADRAGSGAASFGQPSIPAAACTSTGPSSAGHRNSIPSGPGACQRIRDQRSASSSSSASSPCSCTLRTTAPLALHGVRACLPVPTRAAPSGGRRHQRNAQLVTRTQGSSSAASDANGNAITSNVRP